ncbi:MAG TPA: EAL domain-containing protein, partial [Thermoanaerobaculia bacterium]|nr:EAL domain-containing protein [Thermoanaerobaculia bacterium]
MPEWNITLTSVALAQAVAAAIVSRLLLGFFRDYGRLYLRHWSRSWFCLAIFHLVGALALALPVDLAGRVALMTVASVVGGIAGWMQLGWLAAGAWELTARREIAGRRLTNMLFVLALVGAATAIFPAGMALDGGIWDVASVTVRSVSAGVTFLIAGVLVWGAKARSSSFGLRLVSVTFVLYGLNQLHFLGAELAWPAMQRLFHYPLFLGFFDFALQALMGIGVVGSLLEDEREAAVQATVEIEHLAYYDPLTGLPNRMLFMDRLEVALAQATRYEQKMAVMFLDIDRFKEINDSLGHTAGDSLLGMVSERVRRCVRQADTVSRFGGDEFAILIQKIEGFEDAAKVAQKVLESVKSPFMVQGREIGISTSIGISIFPEDGKDAESLLRNADTALFRAKDAGRDNYQLYEAGMNARALERLALESRLRKALAGQQLVLFYQPLVDLSTHKVVAFEALLRWNHPDLGLLSPAEFIHQAEVSGLIIPIGAWVIETACRQAKGWQQRAPGLGVSVNLSARQFQQPDLVRQVAAALESSGLEPRLLELEITETNAMHDAENSIRTLFELKELGVRISMDDFGTGYSSLSYLKRFPIDVLKLDQSFVRDITSSPGDGAIATAVIAMAHSLSLEVVAEGVETRGQLAFLRERLCDRIQGFYFSPPLSP